MTLAEGAARAAITAEVCLLIHMTCGAVIISQALKLGVRWRPGGRIDDSALTDKDRRDMARGLVGARVWSVILLIPALWAIWWGRL